MTGQRERKKRNEKSSKRPPGNCEKNNVDGTSLKEAELPEAGKPHQGRGLENEAQTTFGSQWRAKKIGYQLMRRG